MARLRRRPNWSRSATRELGAERRPHAHQLQPLAQLREADVVGGDAHARGAEEPLALLDGLPPFLDRREVPPLARAADHPEPSLARVERHAAADRELLEHLVAVRDRRRRQGSVYIRCSLGETARRSGAAVTAAQTARRRHRAHTTVDTAFLTPAPAAVRRRARLMACRASAECVPGGCRSAPTAGRSRPRVRRRSRAVQAAWPGTCPVGNVRAVAAPASMRRARRRASRLAMRDVRNEGGVRNMTLHDGTYFRNSAGSEAATSTSASWAAGR
jgi:hypothetical protein